MRTSKRKTCCVPEDHGKCSLKGAMYNGSKCLQKAGAQIPAYRIGETRDCFPGQIQRPRGLCWEDNVLLECVAFAKPAQRLGALAVSTRAWTLSHRGITTSELRDWLPWVPILTDRALWRTRPAERLNHVGPDFRGLQTSKWSGQDACVPGRVSWTSLPISTLTLS